MGQPIELGGWLATEGEPWELEGWMERPIDLGSLDQPEAEASQMGPEAGQNENWTEQPIDLGGLDLPEAEASQNGSRTEQPIDLGGLDLPEAEVSQNENWMEQPIDLGGLDLLEAEASQNENWTEELIDLGGHIIAELDDRDIENWLGGGFVQASGQDTSAGGVGHQRSENEDRVEQPAHPSTLRPPEGCGEKLIENWLGEELPQVSDQHTLASDVDYQHLPAALQQVQVAEFLDSLGVPAGGSGGSSHSATAIRAYEQLRNDIRRPGPPRPPLTGRAAQRLPPQPAAKQPMTDWLDEILLTGNPNLPPRSTADNESRTGGES